MTRPKVVIQKCDPKTPNEDVSAQVAEMLGQLPGIEERLGQARRIFIKVNLGLPIDQDYLGRPLALVGPNARFTGVQSARAARGLTSDCTPTTRSARGG
jgi:hypothetical protein